MSEHKHNHTRYWVRHSEQDSYPVFFVTESNAAHSRAEGDSYAREITQEFYEANVPPEARGAAFPSEREAPKVNGNGAAPEVPTALETIEAYRKECLMHMMNAHGGIVRILMDSPITHAERVFVLEMVKMELCQSLMQQQTVTMPRAH